MTDTEPDTDKQPGAEAHPFAAFLEDYQAGRLNSQLGDKLREVVAAVTEHGKAGELVLKIKVKPEWVNLELQAFGGNGATAFPRIDWVIVGGESGPNARPMHPDWARELRGQCRHAGVPFFFKQWGSWIPAGYRNGTHLVHYGGIDRQAASVVPRENATTRTLVDSHAGRYRHDDLVDRGHPGWVRMRRVGGHGGRELDGETWDQFPDQQGALL